MVPPRRTQQPFKVARPASQKPKDPHILPWWWHPGQLGVQGPPEAFRKQLRRVNEDLRVTWFGLRGRWLIWVKSPSSKNSLCSGWKLLFLWEHPKTHEYLPLNELVFHNLHLIDRNRYANGKEYFDRIQGRIAAEKEAKSKIADADTEDRQRDFYKTTRISTAGKGNRAALHDASSQSLGELQWRQQTSKWRLPKELLDREAGEKEKEFYER